MTTAKVDVTCATVLFRDVRELSELLLGGGEWSAAVAEYSALRAADRAREGNERAKQADPRLEGFGRLGRDSADQAARDSAP